MTYYNPDFLMKLREGSQDFWYDEIVSPLWKYSGRDDISSAEKFVSTSAAIATAAFNPSVLTITHMTSARGRHLSKWAGHYMATAAERSYYKHYLKKSLVPLSARVGSRFIPVVGWALLAHDVYSLVTKGKFMGFKI